MYFSQKKRLAMVFSATVLSLLSLLSQCATFAYSGEVADALQPYVDSGEMPGFVTVIGRTDVAGASELYTLDCVGFADVATQKPMTPDTHFWMASCTKFFTIIAVMQLVEEGKVALDDPLEKYIPVLKDCKVGVKNDDGTILLRAPKTKPTVRQALGHYTGWRFITPLMGSFGIDVLDLQQHAVYMASFPMECDPGEKHQYSNAGIDLAGTLIENVSGMSFEEYLDTRLFKPLGMNDSAFIMSKDQISRLATSYHWRDGNLVAQKVHCLLYPLDDTRRNAEPGGGLFSTANDLTKFCRMIANRGEWNGVRYLSEKTLIELGRMRLDTQNRGEWIGHNGAYATDIRMNPVTGEYAIYLVQSAGLPKQSESRDRWNEACGKILQRGL